MAAEAMAPPGAATALANTERTEGKGDIGHSHGHDAPKVTWMGMNADSHWGWMRAIKLKVFRGTAPVTIFAENVAEAISALQDAAAGVKPSSSSSCRGGGRPPAARACPLPFRRGGRLREVVLSTGLHPHVGKVIFEGRRDVLKTCQSIANPSGRDGSLPTQPETMASQWAPVAWTLEKAGKPGGFSSGGSLAGTYTSDGQKAFIKRDSSPAPQIAEVLASRLINDLFPGAAAVVELVRPAWHGTGWSLVHSPDKHEAWKDVYVASHHHPDFVSVLSEHAAVKAAYGGHFNPVLYVTPLKRGDGNLKRAFPNGNELFDLSSLQKALIGNLLIANNDVHLGNMVLFGQSKQKLSIQAFDFGAAFNMSSLTFHDANYNERVAYDRSARGAIKSEVINQFINYPASWTIDSIQFWTEVVKMKTFDETLWRDLFDYLRLYFNDKVLIDFLKKRVKVGQKSSSLAPCASLPIESPDVLLQTLINQFGELMRIRLDSFKVEAAEMLRKLGGDGGASGSP